ncbi:hypothetical protein [Rhizobium sp. NXC24]|uniref:hypothetical protein n=1 Tax=Rhizobium sp. NXC24 TaxID=2048897 RepID=UPI000CDF535F|nr:hypothetical protein [Rhizobium sp. NXC24]AVA20673.1 hypothetical protein NXC24_CH01006 [Rhizobium sp. NXC24]
MKTRQDLILATLKLLQADGGVGQNPAPENVEDIEGIIDGKLAELSQRQIYGANDPDEFDDVFINPLATILANEAAPSFGQPRNEASNAAAENILRQLKNSTYVPGSVLPVDYF